VARHIKILDAIGIAVPLLLIINAGLGMFVFNDNFHLFYLITSILLIELITLFRWNREKNMALDELL